jgi:hypothetical protein
VQKTINYLNEYVRLSKVTTLCLLFPSIVLASWHLNIYLLYERLSTAFETMALSCFICISVCVRKETHTSTLTQKSWRSFYGHLFQTNVKCSACIMEKYVCAFISKLYCSVKFLIFQRSEILILINLNF